MLMLKALRVRAIALLWGGQALSAIGDEIYRVALIWLAVGLIGADAGYLAAAQSGALLLLSLAGGHWADRWNQRRTMIAVDALRAALVLVPVAAFYFWRINIPVLLVVALSLSGLNALFDPALQATLPEVSPDLETLQAATGLMGTTVRLARAVGPGLVGLLGPLLPTVHFFTLDSLSFGISALSISRMGKLGPAPARKSSGSFRDSLLAGFRQAAAKPLIKDLMLTRAGVAALWGVAFSLGLALSVQRLAPGDMRAFGTTVAFYGLGNLVGALYVGNIRRTRPALIAFGGYVWLGLGFMLIGLAPNLKWLAIACAFAGFGGPVNDVPFFDLIQANFPIEDLPRMFRLRMAVETSAMMGLMALSPQLFREFLPGRVILFCGFGIAALGVAGLSAYGRESGGP